MALQIFLLEVGALTPGVYPEMRRVPFPQADAAKIKRVVVYSGAAPTADAIFNVRVGPTIDALTTIFDIPAHRVKIASGQAKGTVTGLDVAVAQDGWLAWDADLIPAGGLAAPIFLAVVVETTEEIGGYLFANDDNVINQGSFLRLDPIAGRWHFADEQLTSTQIVNAFVRGALARDPTSGELAAEVATLDAAHGNVLDWAAAMKSLGERIFTTFNSNEYPGRGRSDSDYVEDLYRAYLARPSDSLKASWVTLVGTTGRTAVRNGFRDSQEFRELRIMRGYLYADRGYDAGSILGHKISALPADGQTLAYNAAGGSGAGTFDPASLGGTHTVPAGGSTGQALVKNSATDYDYGWGTVSGGGGSTTFTQDVVALAPEFYFRLGEASGAFADSSTHATAATLNGSGYTRAVTGLLAGDTDKALQVAGAADISIPTNARFQPATALVLMALFKPSGSGNAGRSPLITSNHTDYWGNGRGMHLEVDAAGKAHVVIDQGAAAFVHCVGSTVLQGGGTYFIVGMFDGETVTVWVNGVLEGSTDFPHTISWANQTDIRIASNVQAGGGSQVFASGVIDEAVWYNGTLSPVQIRSLSLKALAQVAPDPYLDIEEIDGFVPIRIDGSNFTVGPGACYIPSLNTIKRLNAPVSIYINGILGGTPANSTWYYLYAYWASGRIQFELSTTVPYIYGVNASVKTGDFSRRFTGVCLLTTSGGVISDFWAVSDSKHEVFYGWRELTNTGIWRLVNSGNPGNGSTSGSVSLTAVVPDIVFRKWRFQANANVGSGDVLNLGIHWDSTIPFSAWYVAEYNSRMDLRNGASSATGQMPAWGEIHLLNGRQFVYILGYVTTGSVTIDAKGFSVRR